MNPTTQDRLYDPGFGTNNSMVEGFLHVRLLSASFGRYVGPDKPAQAVTDFTGLTGVMAYFELEVTWRDAAFNSPTGRDVRFASLTKTSLGWKIDGLGTGP